ncbi:MAG: hypothetical protein JW982_04145 [Spirochaetes bacterium]|nr:hypothetical protein [Spirochaetota bacterium]
MAVKKESQKKTGTVIASPAKKPHSPKKTLNDYNAEIMERAFDLYLQRINSGNSGDDVNDWLLAEKEVKKNHRL